MIMSRREEFKYNSHWFCKTEDNGLLIIKVSYCLNIICCQSLDRNIERKQLFVLFQCQGTLECDSYQGHLTCLSFHPWRKIQGRYTQQEAGG